MNTNSGWAAARGAVIEYTLAEAAAQGFVRRLPTGYFDKAGNKLEGPTVKVRIRDGAVIK